MPMATAGSGNTVGVVYPCTTLSPKSVFVTCCTDATATAATAGESIAPLSFAGSNCRWVKIGPNVTKAYLQVVYTLSTVVTQQPVVRVYGAISPDADPSATTGQFPNDGTIPFIRLDNTNAAAGVTLTCTAATDMADTNQSYSSFYKFTNPQSGIASDVTGCTHLLVLCTTAAIGGGTLPKPYIRLLLTA